MRDLNEIHPIFDVPDEAILLAEKIAELLGFHPESVRRWCRSGKLSSYKKI